MINKKITIISTASLLVIFLILLLLGQRLQTQENKLPAKLYLANLNISKLNKDQAFKLVSQKCEELEAAGLNLKYNNTIINIPAVASSLDADLAYAIFHCDKDLINKTLEQYENLSYINRLFREYLPIKATTLKPKFYLDETRIKEYILNSFPDIEKAPQDANFIFLVNDIEIQAEQLGQGINWEKTLNDIQARLNYFSTAPVEIYVEIKEPEIYSQDIIGLEDEAEKITNRSLNLKYDNKLWPMTQANIASWLSVKKNASNLSLEFDKKRIANFLETDIAPQVNLEAKSHRFEMEDGRINNWQPGQDGKYLNILASAEKIIQDYDTNQANESELVVESIKPEEVDSLKIEDILGVGHSNFAGSPANRRHNIEIGFAALHGLIIKPDEEFSLVKALGDIDAASGYLPELVIKGNKTIPEYGGGLCQVATTLFRSALAAGLPITARQNHSYRVSFYEPAGTDAAVYDPAPDVKFINDTGNDILIQAKLEKNDVFLDFWGVKDGRLVEITEPVIYNIVAPPPRRTIETDSLAPGQIKCTESAHNGAKAYFDYTVIYPIIDEKTGEKKQDYTRFNSSYVPWQEVCLVGKAKEEAIIETDSEKNQVDESPIVETINQN